MEKKTDLFNELVDDLQIKTKEYLQVVTAWNMLLCCVCYFYWLDHFQPNPTVRAKMAAVKVVFIFNNISQFLHTW